MTAAIDVTSAGATRRASSLPGGGLAFAGTAASAECLGWPGPSTTPMGHPSLFWGLAPDGGPIGSFLFYNSDLYGLNWTGSNRRSNAPLYFQSIRS